MRDDQPAVRDIRRDLRQTTGNVLIRESMKTIPPHALLVEVFRDCIMIS